MAKRKIPIVEDAERLGDYAKNLYEVTEILEKPVDRALFTEYFNGIDIATSVVLPLSDLDYFDERKAND